VDEVAEAGRAEAAQEEEVVSEAESEAALLQQGRETRSTMREYGYDLPLQNSGS
jgi:hypothetical protein